MTIWLELNVRENRRDNQEWTIQNRRDNQEWTIQRQWQHWAHKTVGPIKK
jgi:hypothetical protein